MGGGAELGRTIFDGNFGIVRNRGMRNGGEKPVEEFFNEWAERNLNRTERMGRFGVVKNYEI